MTLNLLNKNVVLMTNLYDEIYNKGDQNSNIAVDSGILFTHYARNKQIALTQYFPSTTLETLLYCVVDG